MIIKFNISIRDITLLWIKPAFILLCSVILIVRILSSERFFLIPILVALILIIFWLLLISYYVYLKKGVLGEHTVEIKPEYLRETTSYNDTIYKWQEINCVFKNKYYIYIKVSLGTGLIISNKSFASHDELDKFYKLALLYFKQANPK